LNWARLPLLVLGTSDIRHNFHVVAFCLTSHEDHLAYEFLFRAVFESVIARSLNQLPNGLSDSDAAIRLAASKVFGQEITWGNCYSHVVRNLTLKKRKRFIEATNISIFKRDLSVLHAITQRQIFHTALNLFQTKWELREPDIATNFKTEYGEGWKANFFQGAYGVPGLPLSNNGLEGT
ncbi:MAG: hypothetical protein AAGM67_19170, partial [Bacteroidota bacterium]